MESLAKRNSRILLTEKKKNNIIEKETLLSELNSKTIDYQKFKDYIKEKTKLNNELQEFYITDLWRKMKWRQFVYSRKSEDKFLNNIKNVFGDDIVIAYSDWSRSSLLKEPPDFPRFFKAAIKFYYEYNNNYYNFFFFDIVFFP